MKIKTLKQIIENKKKHFEFSIITSSVDGPIHFKGPTLL